MTGGASGIGAATVDWLRSLGAEVASLDVATQRPGDDARDGVHEVRADLRSSEEVMAAVGEAVRALGGLDAVVSNAGVGAVGTVVDNSDEEWHTVLDINVLGSVRLVRAALPHLLESPHPSVVVTTSVVADRGFAQRALYSASKGALQSLALAMAADLLQDGVRVNVRVAGDDRHPVGATAPRRERKTPSSGGGALVARQPLGRFWSGPRRWPTRSPTCSALRPPRRPAPCCTSTEVSPACRPGARHRQRVSSEEGAP